MAPGRVAMIEPWHGKPKVGLTGRLLMLARPCPPDGDKRWQIVQERMRQLGDRPDALFEVLHVAQEAFGYLNTNALVPTT